MNRTIAFAALLALGVAACGSDGSRPSENYGNLLTSPQGLVLVQSEHPTGWTRPDCFVCHQVQQIHTTNRTGLPNCQQVNTGAATPVPCIDLSDVRTIVRNQGEASCAQCHGTNGVQQ